MSVSALRNTFLYIYPVKKSIKNTLHGNASQGKHTKNYKLENHHRVGSLWIESLGDSLFMKWCIELHYKLKVFFYSTALPVYVMWVWVKLLVWAPKIKGSKWQGWLKVVSGRPGDASVVQHQLCVWGRGVSSCRGLRQPIITLTLTGSIRLTGGEGTLGRGFCHHSTIYTQA